jgi:hypothetical protein
MIVTKISRYKNGSQIFTELLNTISYDHESAIQIKFIIEGIGRAIFTNGVLFEPFVGHFFVKIVMFKGFRVYTLFLTGQCFRDQFQPDKAVSTSIPLDELQKQENER